MSRFRVDLLLPPSITADPDNGRRRIRYVDHMIQKWLLVALVVMESALIAIAMWALYRALSDAVEENLYRIHFSADAGVLPRFFTEGVRILLVIGVVNVAAIVAADRIWAAYVHRIVRQLDGMVHAAQQLDFSAQREQGAHHAVLEQARTWRAEQADRLRKLRATTRLLPATLPVTDAERDAAAALLKRMREGDA